MNFSKFKNAAELVGIAGVIGSLMFVGLELRQSSALSRLEAQRAYSIAMSEFVSSWAEPEKAAIIAMLVSDTDPEEFDPIERVQAIGFFTAELGIYVALFEAVEEGILTKDKLAVIEQSARLYWTKFFKFIWPGMSTNYSEAFIDYFESLPWNNKID